MTDESDVSKYIDRFHLYEKILSCGKHSKPADTVRVMLSIAESDDKICEQLASHFMHCAAILKDRCLEKIRSTPGDHHNYFKLNEMIKKSQSQLAGMAGVNGWHQLYKDSWGFRCRNCRTWFDPYNPEFGKYELFRVQSCPALKKEDAHD